MFFQSRWRSRQRHLNVRLSECILTSSIDIITILSNKGTCLSVCLFILLLCMHIWYSVCVHFDNLCLMNTHELFCVSYV